MDVLIVIFAVGILVFVIWSGFRLIKKDGRLTDQEPEFEVSEPTPKFRGMLLLGYSTIMKNACKNKQLQYYGNGISLKSSTKLFTSVTGAGHPKDGFYSDGISVISLTGGAVKYFKHCTQTFE